MRFLSCILGCAIAIPAPAAAQTAPDFSTLRLKVGDTIYVTDLATGVEVSGPVKTLTAAELSINGYSFTPALDLKIERAGDPIWDGALVGSGIGALVSITIGAEVCQGLSQARCTAEFSLQLAAWGALFDWLNKGRTRVYGQGATRGASTARVVPLVSASEGSGTHVRFRGKVTSSSNSITSRSQIAIRPRLHGSRVV